jgi:N-acyl-D-aspartate/D-glutamate deacylase
MSVEAQRPLNWNVLAVTTMNPGGHETQLTIADHAAEAGGRVVALTLPHTMRLRLSFLSGFVLDGFPGWREVLSKPVPERITLLSEPDVRRRLDAGETYAPELRQYEGRTIGDIVDERGDGADPFDVLLDIVVEDELRTGLRPSGLRDSKADWELRAPVWRDPRVVIGGSDAGAHLDMMCGAIYSTAVLSHGVREYQVLSLEEAVHLLTDVPARLYGLRERGRIAPGYAADLVLFDPATVGYEQERMRYDLPGGAWRLFAEATGVHRVLVNGVIVVEEGEPTGATPGTLLRSGRDTATVAP